MSINAAAVEEEEAENLRRFWVDLHIHTVLSPCAELDMGAPEIVSRCAEEGISVIAVTDHNHCGNAAALKQAAGAAESLGTGADTSPLLVLPGMEIQSMEDIHIVLVFPGQAAASAFHKWLWLKMPPIKNDEKAFGYQLIIDHENNVVDQEPILLIQGAQYSVDEIAKRGMDDGALVIPAHLDRPAFSYESALGRLPDEFPCSAIEFSPNLSHAGLLAWKERYPNRPMLRSSDAHKLSGISRSRCTPMLLAEPSFNEIKLAMQNSMGRKILFP